MGILLISSLAVLLCNVFVTHALKPYNMSVLAMLPFTGDEPRKGEACRAAMDVILNEVNSRDDILPDYNLIPVFADEGPGSVYSLNTAFKFRQSLENLTGNSYQSPIMTGPQITTGCIPLGKHIHRLDMVIIGVGCSSPLQTANRRLYPNLYKSRIQGEYVIQPQLHFLKEVGGWNRFGIVANAANLFDYTLASMLMTTAISQGFEISFFDSVVTVDDKCITSLKESETKVILVDTGFPSFVIQFVCMAYKVGITGGRYVFLIHFGSFFEPSTLDDDVGVKGCNKNIVLEQMKITYWLAWAAQPAPDRAATLKSSIGMTLKDYEAKFLAYNKNKKYTDDFKRFHCHDVMLQLILALDRTEKVLALRNMSLRDYREEPTVVMKVANESMANSEVSGFRPGITLKYSPRLEFDVDIQTVTLWQPGQQLVIMEAKNIENKSLDKYASYQTRVVTPPPWLTKDKRPTKDRSALIVFLAKVPEAFFYCIIGVAALSTLLQIVGVIKAMIKGLIGLRHLLAIFGGILLNVAAALFATTASYNTSGAVCAFQRLFCALGFTIINGFLFVNILYFRRLKMTSTPSSAAHSKLTTKRSTLQARGTTSHKTTTKESEINLELRNKSENVASETNVDRRASVRRDSEDHLKRGSLAPSDGGKRRFVVIGMALFFAIAAAYIIVWLSIEQPRYGIVSLTSQPVYNSETDDYEKTEAMVCNSGNDGAWIGVILGVDAAFLAVGSMFAIQLRKVSKDGEVPVVRVNLTCITTLFFGGVLVVIILASPISKMMAMAIVNWLISACFSGIMMKGIFLHEQANNNQLHNQILH